MPVVLGSMARYSFTISNGETFRDTEELPDDEAAWKEALHTMRDVETALSSGGGEWSLIVSRDHKPIYRIDVRTKKIG